MYPNNLPMCECMHVGICTHVYARILAAHCQVDSLLEFFLGRLSWHDSDGVLLGGRWGPPPSGISLCAKAGFKRKPSGQALVPALLEETTALGSEPPIFCLIKPTSLSQGFLLESRKPRSWPSLPETPPSSPHSFRETAWHHNGCSLHKHLRLSPRPLQLPFLYAKMWQELSTTATARLCISGALQHATCAYCLRILKNSSVLRQAATSHTSTGNSLEVSLRQHGDPESLTGT